ncbi:MAG: hypothetical protein J5604_04565 [Bacteroidales bacterium]|nr:hypothetical protein [Bacteroidales bacterium]
MKKCFSLIFAVAIIASLSLDSCSKESQSENAPIKEYRIIIPVNNPSTKAVTENSDHNKLISTFKTTEDVYIAKEGSIFNDTLHPASEGKETISFTGTFTGSSFAAGDIITVLYNTNKDGVVNYSSQDGSIDNVIDAGKGENVVITSISDDIITTSSATLENLQSIFKFTFKCGSNEISGIRFVRIFSENNKLISQYNVLTNSPTYGPITISRSDNLPNNYIYSALRFDSNPGDVIVFQVIDENGKVYSGSKTAPSGGFLNGKFYAPTVDVNLYTFTVASGKKVYFSPGDLGAEVVNSQYIYSFTEPFTHWGQTNTTNYNNATDAKAVSKRTWFDFYFESGLRENFSLYGINNWRIPKRLGSGVDTYEWNYLVNSRTTMSVGVDRYYKITIPGHLYCLLLPPDETQASDIGSDISSGTVTDYLKYIGKGFVLLYNTGTASYSGGWKWNNSSDFRADQGYYWTWYNTSNRYYFTWPDAGPKVDWGSNRMRNHIRYVHDV